MAKNYRFEAGDDDDSDLPETYEPIKSSKTLYNSKQPGLRSRSNAPRARTQKLERLYAAKRALAASQRQVFATAVTEALDGLDLSNTDLNLTKLSAAILTRAQSRVIFNGHFVQEKNRRHAADGFNSTVSEYAKQVNQQRPTAAAQFGELDIIGAKSETGAGRSFVVVRLVGEGADELRDENTGLITALNAAQPGSSPIESNLYNPKACISFASSYSYLAAETLMTRLQDEGVVETVTAQLGSEANPNHLAGFGRLLPDPFTNTIK